MSLKIGIGRLPIGSGGGSAGPNGAPSGLTLTVLSDTSIKLDWTAGSTNQDGHSIERSTDGVTYAEITTVLGATVTYSNTGLTAATLYYYRVRAYKGALYSVYSNVVYDVTGTPVTLPQKLIITPPVYTEEMDSITGWTFVGTGELNTSEKYSGTGSIKLTSASGAISKMSKAVSWDLSANSGKSLRVWVYPHSDSATFANFTIYAGDATLANYFVRNWTGNTNSLAQNKWTLLWNDPNVSNEWAVGAGNPNWNNITYIRIQPAAKASQIRILSFDLLIANEVRKPCVIIGFDDTSESIYLKAYPLIKAKGMVATAYVISNQIGSASRMTAVQLQVLNAHMWDIANHTKDHASLTTLNESQQEADIVDCKNVLDGLGLTRASLHVSYPGGNNDANTLLAMAAVNAKTGRTVGGSGYSMYEQGTYFLGFPFKLNASGPINTTTLAAMKTIIDNCVALNISCMLYFHDIVDSNADISTKWLTSQFSDLLDYIESLNLQTLTIDEYYRLDSGPITVHHK